MTVVLVVALGVVAGAYLGRRFGRQEGREEESERTAALMATLLDEARARELKLRRLAVEATFAETLFKALLDREGRA